MLLFIILILVLSSTAFADDDETPVKKSYSGDKVFRLVPTTQEHLKWLQDMRINSDPNFFDFWTEQIIISNPVDIHVNKNFEGEFRDKLAELKIENSVSVPDLQKLIDDVDKISLIRRRREIRRRRVRNRIDAVGTFAVHSAINAWLNETCSSYRRLSRCGSIGKTYEGRDIRYIQLGVPKNVPKKIIFIEGGIHAREWLAHATVVYLVNRLLTTYNKDSTAKRMLDTFNFIMVPVVNPDGYEYSRTDRMWRKTRSRSNTSMCLGVDGNRNYDMSFGLSGTSDNPCSDIYAGPRPFSEPETKAMSDFMRARKDSILAFFTLHSFAQQWLVPYGDQYKHYPADFDELLRVATIGVKALMAINNDSWQVGNTVDTLYPASGGGDDWAKSIGIKYSYTLELSPSIRGRSNGFVVPESEIEPTGREVWAGITAAVDAMLK